MRHVRAFLFAVLLAVAPMAFAIAASANTGHQPIWVSDQTDVRTFYHPCHDGDVSGTCKLVVTTTVPAHYVLPDAPGLPLLTTARACYGPYYIWPSVKAADYNALGIEVTEVDLSAENWYNGCSSGAVWVNGSCWANAGYSCSNGSWGGFWDGGHRYYQDWTNWNTTLVPLNLTVTWYLRIHVYPNGTWSRWCYNTGAGSC